MDLIKKADSGVWSILKLGMDDGGAEVEISQG